MRIIELTAMDITHSLMARLKTTTVHEDLIKIFKDRNTELTDGRSKIRLSAEEVREIKGY